MVFPGVPHRVCWEHKMRNIFDKVTKKDQPPVHRPLKRLFAKKTDTRAKAEKIINKWKRDWRGTYAAAVRSLEVAQERLLNYLE